MVLVRAVRQRKLYYYIFQNKKSESNINTQYGRGRKATRQLLVKHGFDGATFTEKSLKVQGVTELLDAGVSLENVMVLGRWKRTTTPLHYRNLSANFLLTVAGRLPM